MYIPISQFLDKHKQGFKQNFFKLISVTIFLSSSVAGLGFNSVIVSAIGPTFDPNQILSSSDIYSLPDRLNSASKIQTFLEEQNSPLAKYYFDSTLDEAKGKRFTASEFIWAVSRTRLANRCGVRFKELCIDFEKNPINPAFVLALIQREQGLIYGQFSSQDPFSDNLKWKIDRIVGYACMEDPAYRCTDDNAWWQQYRGFDRQLYWGIWMTMFSARSCELGEPYSNRGGSFPANYQVNKPMTIDGQTITPVNGITCGLYVYTPHITGQRNLYNFFQRYNFGFKPGVYSLSLDQKIAERQSFVLSVNSADGTFSPTGFAVTFRRNKELGLDAPEFQKVITTYNYINPNQISLIISRDNLDKDFYLPAGLYDVTIQDYAQGKSFTLNKGFRLIDYVTNMYSPAVIDILGDKTGTFESNLINQGAKAYLVKGKTFDQLQELKTLEVKFNSIKVQFPDNMTPDIYPVLVITKDGNSLLYDKVKLSSGDEAKIASLSKLLCGGGQELRESKMVTLGALNMQKCLKDKGFYTKEITGVIDGATITAQKKEIADTLSGKVDPKTGKSKS